MSRQNRLTVACLLTGLALLMIPPFALAQPRFSFGAASSSDLLADVLADDYVGPPEADTQTAGGFVSPLRYSGGLADWGNTISIGVGDGEIVMASANPLVRLDGDGTQQVRIAWKAWTLLDSNFVDPTQWYRGTGIADTDAFLALALTGLTVGESYEVWYYWTFEADAEEEHEVPPPPGDDPAAANGLLELDIATAGPGQLINEQVDNFTGAPTYNADTGSGSVQFTAVSTSVPIVIELEADSESEINDPPRDDLASCIFRGTLVLRLLSPVIIITEIVDGDLPGGNPKFVELTNCGEIDVAFGSSDYLAVYFNGSTTPAVTVALDGYALGTGESLVVASSANGGDQAFFDTYGFQADLYTPESFGNGNDTYSLESGGVVRDTYGIIGVDGAASPWEYTDSYAYSRPLRFPNAGMFDFENWVIGTWHALDAPTDPERITLLQILTTPGVHYCEGGPVIVPGDLNNDGVVDLVDFIIFAACFGGPGVPSTADCQPADFDGDGDVDLNDFALFQQYYTGP